VVALQPSVGSPAHVCVATCSLSASGSPRVPSTATTRSPTWSTLAAAPPVASASTWFVVSARGAPQMSRYALSSTIASTMLTAGPAPITTIRFHTGWRK
jgi:hypothetical protein